MRSSRKGFFCCLGGVARGCREVWGRGVVVSKSVGRG